MVRAPAFRHAKLQTSTNKKLAWIRRTDQRFRDQNCFGDNPALMVEWFDQPHRLVPPHKQEGRS